MITGYVESYTPELVLTQTPRLKSAYDMVNLIREDAMLSALIEQIHFEKEGRIVMVPKIGDEKIILDHLDELPEKLSDLKKFYKHLAKTNGWGKFEEIDISYKDQVVGRSNTNP